ncbi:MAG: hypothetical protein J3K34DRAFT_520232 [Monoraphidium minutum]|nr:MAG: hypothetical protein J3K34DRAFT_520232 [Monoraphidium minutum]
MQPSRLLRLQHAAAGPTPDGGGAPSSGADAGGSGADAGGGGRARPRSRARRGLSKFDGEVALDGASSHHKRVAGLPTAPLELQQRTDLMSALMRAGLQGDEALRVLKVYEKNYGGLRTALPPPALPGRVAAVVARLQGLAPQITRMVATDPRLLLRTPDVLEAQLLRLRFELSAQLPPECADHYAANCLRLATALLRPQWTATRLAMIRSNYIEVLGAPPALITLSCRSSHLSYDPATLRGKLVALAEILGREQAHIAISRSPHLLASDPSRLAANTALLLDRLRPAGAPPGAGALPPGGGATPLTRALLRQPRLMSTTPALLERNFGVLKGLLDCSEEELLRVVRSCPQLLTLSTVTTSAKLEELRDLLMADGKQLLKVLRQQPTVLLNTTNNMALKLASLEELLGCSRERAAALARRSPALLTFNTESLARKMREIEEVLGLPPNGGRPLYMASPTLLNYMPSTLSNKLAFLQQRLGLSADGARQFFQRAPAMAACCMETLEARVLLFRQLAAQSPAWAAHASRGGAAGGPSDGPLPWLINRFHASGRRLLLRMEFLLATGHDRDVSVTSALRMSEAAWAAAFGGLWGDWQAERLRQLRAPDAPELWRRAMGRVEVARFAAAQAAAAAAAGDGGGGGGGAEAEAAGAGGGSGAGAAPGLSPDFWHPGAPAPPARAAVLAGGGGARGLHGWGRPGGGGGGGGGGDESWRLAGRILSGARRLEVGMVASLAACAAAPWALPALPAAGAALPLAAAWAALFAAQRAAWLWWDERRADAAAAPPAYLV